MPSTTVLSYRWTCQGGNCDAGAVGPEWATRIQQDNILVVNVHNGSDNGTYTCTVTHNVGTDRYTLSVASEYAVALVMLKSDSVSSVMACFHLHKSEMCMPAVS